MCGIIGYSGNTPYELDKIKLLFFDNQHRGEHSCGYYNHDESKEYGARMEKKLGKAVEVLLPSMNIPPSEMFFGHVRAATVGNKTVENAHPFHYGNTIGVHNGTLDRQSDLCKHFDLDWIKDIKVDSQILFQAINKHNNYEVLQTFEGAAAVLFTRQDGILYAFRNKERPLFRGVIKYTDGTRGMYLASREEGLKIIGCSEVREVCTDILYQISEGNIQEHKKLKRLTLPKPTYNYTTVNVSTSTHHSEKNKENIVVSAAKQGKTPKKMIPLDGGNSRRVEWSDGTISVYDVRKHYTKKQTGYKCMYDSNRNVYLHVSYYDDGGFEETKISFENAMTIGLGKTFGQINMFEPNPSGILLPVAATVPRRITKTVRLLDGGEEVYYSDGKKEIIPAPKPAKTEASTAVDESPSCNCPNCDEEADPKDSECGFCGLLFNKGKEDAPVVRITYVNANVSENWECEKCNATVAADAKECPVCNTEFVDEEAPVHIVDDEEVVVDAQTSVAKDSPFKKTKEEADGYFIAYLEKHKEKLRGFYQAIKSYGSANADTFMQAYLEDEVGQLIEEITSASEVWYEETSTV